MEEIERLARITAARFCLYAAIAIGAVVASLAFDPRVALQAGGILALMLALVLLLRASSLEGDASQDPGRLVMGAVRAAQEPHLRRLILRALCTAYLDFARAAAAASGACSARRS